MREDNAARARAPLAVARMWKPVALMLAVVPAVTACPVLDALARAPASGAGISAADAARAATSRPHEDSKVRGSTAADAFRRMNEVLHADDVRTAACDAFDHEALNSVATVLQKLHRPELNAGYRAKRDRRSLHFESFDYKEALWKAEAKASAVVGSYAPGSPNYNATRDGKCAEAVMWYTHHLAEEDRARLAQVEAFVLPLMPLDLSPAYARGHEYDQQIGCTSCHVAVHIPGTPPITPIPAKNSSGPQYPVTCPTDSKTGLPTVWYNRTKRCDWDYEPFCRPCEGVGGMTWGPNEDDWNPMSCEVVMKPGDVTGAPRLNPQLAEPSPQKPTWADARAVRRAGVRSPSPT